MAEVKLVTCKNCKKQIEKSTAYNPAKGQYFCDENCYAEYKTPKHTCYVCKKQHKESDMAFYLKHWVCKKCLPEWLDSEETQRDLFLDYVWNLYDKDYQTSNKYMLIRKQAEYYHKEYGFKYKGMLLAVKYHIDTLEKVWYNDYGLGQVFPATYIQLKENWQRQHELSKLVVNCQPKSVKVAIGRRQPIRKGMLSLE